MPRHQRYILRQLVGPFVLFASGLMALVWLTQSLRVIDLIVNKGLSLGTFLFMSVLLLPTFMGVILPVALFCALLFVYNRLAADSELVSLRAAGVSPWALATPAILLATAVAVLSYASTMYLTPNSHRAFKERQFVLRGDHSSVLLRDGAFNALTDDLTVYVRARGAGGVLEGILVHDSRTPGKPVTMMAESGVLARTDQGPRFILANGNRQQVDRKTAALSYLHFERYTMDLGGVFEAAGTRWREPRERFIHELFSPMEDDATTRRHRGKFLAEAHNRIVSPLFAYMFAAIALAALLSGELDRRGQWRRILAASVAGIAVQVAGLFLVNAVAGNDRLIPLMYLNVAVAVGVAVFVLHRRPRGGRAAVLPASSGGS